METVADNKNERINIRLKSSAKRLIEKAAGCEGRTVSHFILTSALEKAEETVRRHEQMALSREDAVAFFNALGEPVRFNKVLTEAFEEYDTSFQSK